MSFARPRDQHARIIEPSMIPIPIKLTCVPLVWVQLLVLVMVVLFPILWLIFTRENSKSISYLYGKNLLICYFGLKAKKCRLFHLSSNLIQLWWHTESSYHIWCGLPMAQEFLGQGREISWLVLAQWFKSGASSWKIPSECPQSWMFLQVQSHVS